VLDLARGEAELALRVVPAKEANLRVRKVASLTFGVVASEGYLRKRGHPRSEDELAGHDAVMYGGELSTLPESKWLAARRGVRVALRTNSMTTLFAAVTEGAGIAVISGRFGEQELGLVRVFDVPALPPRRLWLVSHPDAASRPAVRAVADHVTALLTPRK